MNAVGLFLDSNLVGSLLLLIDAAPKPKLAAENDSLLDKAALFSTSIGATANLLALHARSGPMKYRGEGDTNRPHLVLVSYRRIPNVSLRGRRFTMMVTL